MTREHGDDEFIELIDDVSESIPPRDIQPWCVLIVDDEEEVHTSTVYALSNLTILGRPLNFVHAYSAEEARRALLTESDVAVAFLDVVMEAEDAGLQLIRVIREDLGLTEMRIILRTGQPGYAPEIDAIRDYDINDYRTKSELTRTRLVTSLTAALRSYEQVRTIAYSRQGLEKIVLATSDLFERRALESLAEGVLTQIAGLLGFKPNGVVCAQRGFPLDGSDRGQLYIVGAVGNFAAAINRPLTALGEPRIEAAIKQSIDAGHNIYADDHTVLYLRSQDSLEEAIFLGSGKPLSALDQQLLEVFACNISVGFANVYLFHRLNYLAFHDSLTDLPNRQRLAELIEEGWREGHSKCVVYLIDIDHFSDVNDALGTTIGDGILRAVVTRLRTQLPEQVQIGRYAGDVFCVVTTPGTVSPETILKAFRDPIEVQEYRLPVSVTVGECSGESKRAGAQILKNAGLALSHAKRNARGRHILFTREMVATSSERLYLIQELRSALATNMLAVHFQPQVDLITGRLVAAEALLRWYRADGPPVPPGKFIPLAERSGLIGELSTWVIGEACRTAAEWAEQGLGHLRVAVNLSPLQIRFGHCADILHQAIEAHGIDSSQVEIEITESALVDDVAAASRCLERFKSLGVSIALDDFGTGCSALAYLKRLPIDVIKIDQSFVQEVGSSGDVTGIAEMIARLGQHLRLTTVAEGIETEEQREAARRWGATLAQGFLYAPAMAAEEFVAWARREGGER